MNRKNDAIMAVKYILKDKEYVRHLAFDTKDETAESMSQRFKNMVPEAKITGITVKPMRTMKVRAEMVRSNDLIVIPDMREMLCIGDVAEVCYISKDYAWKTVYVNLADKGGFTLGFDKEIEIVEV